MNLPQCRQSIRKNRCVTSAKTVIKPVQVLKDRGKEEVHLLDDSVQQNRELAGLVIDAGLQFGEFPLHRSQTIR